MDEPVQSVLAFAVEVAVLLIVEAVGRILHQTLIVGTGVALHRRHDEGRIGVVQIIRHAPALAVGGVLVEKHVLPVEHIQHRIPPPGVGVVHGRQVNIGPAFFFAPHCGVADAPLLYHLLIPSRHRYALSVSPTEENCNPHRVQKTPPGAGPGGVWKL